MNPVRRRRLLWILLLLLGVGGAAALALSALQQNINLFYTPSQITRGEAPRDTRIRAGGMVEQGSLVRAADSLAVSFVITDFQREVRVSYAGILPDLFREGQGVVALGRLDDQGRLVADQILAKHDEKYMPPEVSQALRQAGRPLDGARPAP
ncbi:cytochrome c maturation protein CcmE [Pseudomonas oryzihabitans]|uniref:Cytochrome c-type biogenesis protein CcmE n=1 Tax=Pseudomonas oryzihabitans TaxID=47885 RepID=A0ABX3INL9_9PSED|nr:cytochrome c maturation protein CcmE [Pseudomonas psychrotolerans]ONN69923.1 cytochrome c biogenesis protein CcmE [Pseudomonas psychrotolerans]